MDQVGQLGLVVGIVVACAVLGVARASFYRAGRGIAQKTAPDRSRAVPARALNPTARAAVIEVLHQQRFADLSVREVYAALLDEGRYLCSIASMYRLLRALGENRERRAQRRESHQLAGRLLTESMAKQRVTAATLTVHSDRGSPMKAKPLVQLLADLGVTKSLSWPRVSNDNPYSESQFKTLKYCSAFPERFGSLQDACAFCRQFFTWYNRDHHHSGLGLLTPHSVHYGLADTILAGRQAVLEQAFAGSVATATSRNQLLIQLPTPHQQHSSGLAVVPSTKNS